MQGFRLLGFKIKTTLDKNDTNANCKQKQRSTPGKKAKLLIHKKNN
jgi:hypothetical protein